MKKLRLKIGWTDVIRYVISPLDPSQCRSGQIHELDIAHPKVVLQEGVLIESEIAQKRVVPRKQLVLKEECILFWGVLGKDYKVTEATNEGVAGVTAS